MMAYPPNCPIAPAGPTSAMPPPGGVLPVNLNRVLQVAGPFSEYTRHPELEDFESQFRVEPDDSWFSQDRSPQSPIQFEVGAITTGDNQMLLIYDYSVDVWGFSGVNPHDFEPLEDGRHSGSFGYVLRINGSSPGALRYRLDPVSPNLRPLAPQIQNALPNASYNPGADVYARAFAEQFASAAGFGASVHPQTPGRYGARDVPFTLFVQPNAAMDVTGVIFNPIESPIAFVQARLSGYVVSAKLGQKIVDDLRMTLR